MKAERKNKKQTAYPHKDPRQSLVLKRVPNLVQAHKLALTCAYLRFLKGYEVEILGFSERNNNS